MLVERAHQTWERYHMYVSRSCPARLSFHCKRFRPTTSSHPNVALCRDGLTPGPMQEAIRLISAADGSAPATRCIASHKCPAVRWGVDQDVEGTKRRPR